jgi:predicted P-loop ATPase
VTVIHDEFERRALVQGIPDIREWDDDAIKTVRGTADFFGLRLTAEFTSHAVEFLSGQHRVHPVRDYLDGLKWDGTKRIDTWLRDLVGVDDNEYTRAVGAKFLIAAVRRVRKPGTKFDTMLILEGVQGSGKSSVGRILVPDEQWFTDSLPIGVDPKITIERTAAKWIVELAELTGISRRDVENVKAFITRQTDEAREAFARKATRAQRQFVLLGTTNDDRYLIDGTGNRRFLPIRVLGGAGSIDLNGIRTARDQLWAEAAVREAEGEPIELPREMWGLANAEQEQRRLIHPIEERLVELLEGVEVGFISNKEIWRALEFKVPHTETRHRKIVDDTMQRLGWQRVQEALKIGSSFRQRGWFKGENYRDCILSFQPHPSDAENGVFLVETRDQVRRRSRANSPDQF